MSRPKSRHNLPHASEICRTSAVDLAQAIRARRLSVREVTTAFLDRIDAVNPSVNAIVSLRDRSGILAEADEKDRLLATGAEIGPLFGLPMAIKDLAETKGLRTTHGSPIFTESVPAQDDIFVERLRAAGAIFIGKTNVPEFGLGSHTYNPVFGPTRNAFDPALTAGGSSGGAAVALALDMVPLADGSDYGGSLRNPAAFNNVYGMRPSQGAVPAGPTGELFLSQIGIEGPMARNVGDLALLLDVQAGWDARAPLSVDLPIAGSPSKNRIAWLGDLGGYLPMEDGVLEVCERAVRRFERADFVVEPVLPDFDFEALWSSFVTIRQATSGSSLKAHHDDPVKRSLLKPEAIWEVEGGMRLFANDVFAASVVRSDWYRTMLTLFDRFDALAIPTAQVFPFDIDMTWPREIAGRGMTSYHRWMEVVIYASMAGCPAINVPAGFSADGRPMGLQLIGPPRADHAVIDLAKKYEAMLDWESGAG